ncbi:16S rRNA (guanine(527)-N(7))-methyltransferase RsmG [Helicobacter sp.]|uniref:16S rRNA (guanine(527)-N(7))-methyltransferase RsmG n=1 Tax=Helicobacter sp. TaxID=218 RepID=UPI0025BB84A4|nr:16S rRNA (guanine(527)-N(7))-methyltransferase RsmG [Helicobacter sp.]MCI5968944.1 16S rRNA (guanine(527)-N(7))-methyltransferase RsmG [Helicobacter sp.]MDY2584310.1 16S rRNA (guanine(527)-N(7))-methyltransferase RsmG [Helicobacter sp.]
MQLNHKQQELLENYTQMLLSWNAIHSLSGAKDAKSIQKNIENSLYPLSKVNLNNKHLLLDIGSGNGFPAIPLHIALEIPTILCEPNAKKASFLQNIKAHLKLTHLSIARKKIESLNLESLPDFITSRAAFDVKMLLEKCKHCIKNDTTLLLYKGSNVENELPKGLKHSRFAHTLSQYLIINGKDILC